MRLNNAEKILSIFRTKFAMGASISFESKYRLILDTEVECVSLNPPSSSPKKKAAKKRDSGSGSESGSESDSGSESGSGSGSGSESDGSDADNANKTYTVKVTPEIAGYIRSYLRKTQFLDEFDLITEIELDKYNHTPGSALVFNSDSIAFNVNNQTLESLGDWEYLPPDDDTRVEASKSKSKSKSKKHRRDDDDDDGDKPREYKTKDDDLPVSEIEHILKEKFEEYNKTREFIIHESKNSFLCLKINSVEIVKA
jgi:hypothetical protein